MTQYKINETDEGVRYITDEEDNEISSLDIVKLLNNAERERNHLKPGVDSKLWGYYCDHVKSKCCQAKVRFIGTNDWYSIEVWCEKCGNYKITGRLETLIAFWLGDKEAVIKNKGYLPDWYNKERSDLISQLNACRTQLNNLGTLVVGNTAKEYEYLDLKNSLADQRLIDQTKNEDKKKDQ
jgi:hypothetical protein